MPLSEEMIRSMAAEESSSRPDRFNGDRGWVLKEYGRFGMRRVEVAMGVVSVALLVLLFAASWLPP